jgi:uncharacterized protein
MARSKDPLSDEEYNQIADVLARFPGERAMNLEMLDGFFAALACGPDHVRPSEFLPEILGETAADSLAFGDASELELFLALTMRHWNAVVHALSSDDVFVPLLLEDDNGVAHGNDWANGFARGIELRRDEWSDLFDDREHAGSLIPVLALAHEHHPDPQLRPYQEPMSAQRREELIVAMAAAVPAIYHYFAADRQRTANETRKYRPTTTKVGRNYACPCGSGKKFKNCCGALTLH